MKRFKVFGFICLGLLILGVGWVSFRHIYLKNRYAPFLSKMDEGDTMMRYDNRYTCGVGMPQRITHIRGNLYVTPFRMLNRNENGEMVPVDQVSCDLLIYVEFPSGYTVWADLSDGSGNAPYRLNLSETMELLSDDAEQRRMYDLYYDSIYDSYEAANQVFGILSLPPGRK